MPGFSFLSRSDREQIDQTTEMSGETKRDVEQMVPGGFADFPAKLTAYDSSSGYYSWTRRAWDSNRARYDHPATAQVGTPTSNPAKFPNGDVVDVSTPVDVWLRPVGIRTTVGMVHEVVGGPAASSSSQIGIPFVLSNATGYYRLTITGGLYQVVATFTVGLGATDYAFGAVANLNLHTPPAGVTMVSSATSTTLTGEAGGGIPAPSVTGMPIAYIAVQDPTRVFHFCTVSTLDASITVVAYVEVPDSPSGWVEFDPTVSASPAGALLYSTVALTGLKLRDPL